jgi:hypothetical protein
MHIIESHHFFCGVWLGALGVGILANPAFLQPLNLYRPVRLPHILRFIVLIVISIKSAGS